LPGHKGAVVYSSAVLTIVTAHYRYKRPPRKRSAVAIDVPAPTRGDAADALWRELIRRAQAG